jgi:hypothetical protein
MSPVNKSHRKVIAPNNLYTAVLGVSFVILLVTSAFVAFKCFTQYGTLFTIPS